MLYISKIVKFIHFKCDNYINVRKFGTKIFQICCPKICKLFWSFRNLPVSVYKRQLVSSSSHQAFFGHLPAKFFIMDIDYSLESSVSGILANFTVPVSSSSPSVVSTSSPWLPSASTSSSLWVSTLGPLCHLLLLCWCRPLHRRHL